MKAFFLAGKWPCLAVTSQGTERQREGERKKEGGREEEREERREGGREKALFQ